MMKILVLPIVLIFLMLPACHCSKKREMVPGSLEKTADPAELQRAINKQLRLISDSGTLHGAYLNFPDTMQVLFRQNDFTANWLHQILGDSGLHLRYIQTAALATEDHGLEPDFYHYNRVSKPAVSILKHCWDSIVPYDSLALVLIYAADAATGIYHDLSSGRVNADYTGSLDALPKRKCGSLQHLLRSEDFANMLRKSFPSFEPYAAMQREYQRLLYFPKAQLGMQIHYNKTIRLHDSLPLVHKKALGRKLRMHGVLQMPDSLLDRAGRYEKVYSDAVKVFQMKNGLAITGAVDKKTCDALNNTRELMLLRLRVNLERWRWMGPVTENSRIWVNIAENKLYAFKQDTLKLEMNVCSGKNRDEAYYERLEKSKTDEEVLPPDNLETPLMKATLTHMVVNPSWFVPRNIMIKELLPQIKKDPAVLEKHHYVLRNSKGEEVDPYSVNWGKVTTKNWKYRIEQLPGEDNSLGKVVIHFPNAFSIFMHDTPAKSAFSWEKRHVSHGCVRLEEPLKMVEFLTSLQEKNNLDDILIASGTEPKIDKKKIEKYREQLKDSAKAEKLKPKPNAYFKAQKSVPVYIVYFTCAMNAAGGFQYVSDGYARDAKMLEQMKKPRKKQPANTAKIAASAAS